MNRKLFEKIITEKRAKCSNERPKYGLRKLTVGVVSCLLGYMMFFTPNVVAAEKVDAPQAQAIEAKNESTEANTGQEVKQPKEEADAETSNAETGVAAQSEAQAIKESSSVNKKSAVQEKSATTTEATADTTEQSTEFKLTDEQKKKLVEAGLTDGEIEFVTNEIKSELATDKNFNVDEYLTKVIKLKKEGKNIGAESTSIKNEISISDRGPEDSNQQAQPASEEFVEEKAKENWDKKPQDKSRWAVGEKQRLVRVTTSDPIEMNDVDYDGTFVDANGRTVIRLLYKEKSAAATGVWYRALFNFGELDQYIDYDQSYVVGVDVVFGVASEQSDKKPLTPFNDRKERMFDLGKSRGDGTNTRKNLPINLVLKKGVTLKDLEGKIILSK